MLYHRILGVLTSGHLDDGRGHARSSLFKHKHEMDTGRTSCVGMEIMGFDSRGRQVVNGVDEIPIGDQDAVGNDAAAAVGFTSAAADDGNSHQNSGHRRMGWEEISARAAKVITFLDLAGHERYLKTTVFGMTGGAPDYVMLIVRLMLCGVVFSLYYMC